MKTNMVYEIKFESKTDSGIKMVLAESDKEAFKRFRLLFNSKGLPIPSYWLVGIWSVN